MVDMNDAFPPDSPPDDDKLGSSPAEQIIALFGGIRPMAGKLSIPVTTVQGWKKRGHIPLNRHESITAGAASLGLALEPALLAQAGIERMEAGPGKADEPAEALPSDAAVLQQDNALERPKVEAATSPRADAPPPKDPPRPLPIDEKPVPPPRRGKESTVPPVRSGRAVAWIALLIGLTALGAAVTQPLWSPVLLRAVGREPAIRPAAYQETMAALQAEIVNVRSELDSLKHTAFAEIPPESTADFAARLTAIEARQEAGGEAASVTLPALQTRLADLETQTAAAIARLQGFAVDLPAQVTAQRETLAQLTQQVLQTRVELQSLRREVQGNSLPQLQAQARALMLLQLRAALQSAAPFTAELQAAVQQSAADPALQEFLAPVFAALEPIAARGAPSGAQLAAALPALARAAAETERAREGGGFWDRVLARLSSLVSVRIAPDEAAVGDGLSAALARAEAALGRDDLAAAATAIAAQQNLPDAVGEWLAQARDRLQANAALPLLGQAVVQALPRNGPAGSALPVGVPPLVAPPVIAPPVPTPVPQETSPSPEPPARLELPPMIGTP